MIFILGGQGFVGSAYARLFEAEDIPFSVITRQNYPDFIGRRCDVLINANGNSKKFLAEKDPKWEFDASTRSVVHALEDIRSDVYIQLSTGDVYPSQRSPAETLESQNIDSAQLSRYGLHKLIAEFAVKSLHPRHLIFRMGGFVGPGMKKNAIFDLMQGAPIWISPQSQLQFISTDTAARLVWSIYQAGVRGEIVNLGGRGVVKISDVIERLSSRSGY